MTSEVEQRPRLVTAGQPRSHGVSLGVDGVAVNYSKGKVLGTKLTAVTGVDGLTKTNYQTSGSYYNVSVLVEELQALLQAPETALAAAKKYIYVSHVI